MARPAPPSASRAAPPATSGRPLAERPPPVLGAPTGVPVALGTGLADPDVAGSGTAWPVTSIVSPISGVLDWLLQLSTTGGSPEGPYRLNVNDFGTRMLSVPGSVKASWPVTVNVE